MNKVKNNNNQTKKAVRYNGRDPILAKAFIEKQENFKVFKVSCFPMKASVFSSPD